MRIPAPMITQQASETWQAVTLSLLHQAHNVW